MRKWCHQGNTPSNFHRYFFPFFVTSSRNSTVVFSTELGHSLISVSLNVFWRHWQHVWTCIQHPSVREDNRDSETSGIQREDILKQKIIQVIKCPSLLVYGLHQECVLECLGVSVFFILSYCFMLFNVAALVNIREVKVKAQCDFCRVFDVTHRLLERTSLVWLYSPSSSVTEAKKLK